MATVRQAIERAIAPYLAFTLLDLFDFRESQVQIFASVQAAMYALPSAIVLPGLIGMRL